MRATNTRKAYMYIVASDEDLACVGYIKATSTKNVEQTLKDELKLSGCDPKFYSIKVVEITGERREFVIDGGNVVECTS